jgi:hypothetical protein
VLAAGGLAVAPSSVADAAGVPVYVQFFEPEKFAMDGGEIHE